MKKLKKVDKDKLSIAFLLFFTIGITVSSPSMVFLAILFYTIFMMERL